MNGNLDHRELTLIKRAAEDACHAMNRHYKPFIDAVAKPLMIISLVDMAQSRQDELDQAYSDIETFAQAHQRECDIKFKIANELKEKDKRIAEILSVIAKAKDGYYGFSKDGGDTDNLVFDLEKALQYNS